MDETDNLGENDHRRLGKQLDLFVTSDLVGSGLPMLTPRGTVLKEELAKYSNELREANGFQKVWTPHLTKSDLYGDNNQIGSGHWEKFGDELFLVKSQETKDKLVLKPMNCPHHVQIYSSRPRSYREMPVKYLETATVYRDEKSGELQGLARVRSINMDDSHVFCSDDQVETVINELIEAAQTLYKTLDMPLSFRLSFGTGSAREYLGDPRNWQKAEETIEEIAKKKKLKYAVARGDAAFYGPKIDFLAKDVHGRVWQVATIQLDYVMPGRFELSYVDNNNQPARPVMIHCALLGSIERFLAVYIEHTSGKFPVWLAPEQLRIATLNNDEAVVAKAAEIARSATAKGLRATIDASNESVGKKIAEAEMMKVPIVIVIGKNEVETNNVSPRYRGDFREKNLEREVSVSTFIKELSEKVDSRSL